MTIERLAERWRVTPWEAERLLGDPAMLRWVEAAEAVDAYEDALARGRARAMQEG